MGTTRLPTSREHQKILRGRTVLLLENIPFQPSRPNSTIHDRESRRERNEAPTPCRGTNRDNLEIFRHLWRWSQEPVPPLNTVIGTIVTARIRMTLVHHFPYSFVAARLGIPPL